MWLLNFKISGGLSLCVWKAVSGIHYLFRFERESVASQEEIGLHLPQQQVWKQETECDNVVSWVAE